MNSKGVTQRSQFEIYNIIFVVDDEEQKKPQAYFMAIF